MPLIPETMINPFTQLFKNGTPVAADAADRMATAYTAYCATALFGPNKPIFTGSEKAALQGVLLAAMNPFIGIPAAFALAWQNGIQAFWMAPPISVVGVSQTGAVTSILGATSVAAQLTALFSNPLNTAETSAIQLAAVLDAATHTVQATVAPPPATLIPIS